MGTNDDLKTTEFQGFLQDEYAKYAERTKRWRPSLSEFARYLGVSAASMDHWMMGSRTPDLQNAIRLAERLGPRVYDLLGFPHMAVLNDIKLRFIVENWEMLDDATRREIIGAIQSEVGGEPG